MQAVEPNSLTTAVSVDSQRGQAIVRLPCSSSRFVPPSAGGAMPYSRSFSLPSLLIQSVVHGLPIQGVDDALFDHLGGRTTRIRWREFHDHFIGNPDIPQDAEIGDRQDRNLRVSDLG